MRNDQPASSSPPADRFASQTQYRKLTIMANLLDFVHQNVEFFCCHGMHDGRDLKRGRLLTCQPPRPLGHSALFIQLIQKYLANLNGFIGSKGNKLDETLFQRILNVDWFINFKATLN
jgi:hypothetical protein